jgi:hypothetical protein
MFSVITKIYSKKTKRSSLMELFTATGKLKKVFLTTRVVRCVHHAWWHGTHRYDIQVLAKHALLWVHRYSSLLQWSVPLGQRGHVAMVGRTSIQTPKERIVACLTAQPRLLYEHVTRCEKDVHHDTRLRHRNSNFALTARCYRMSPLH